MPLFVCVCACTYIVCAARIRGGKSIPRYFARVNFFYIDCHLYSPSLYNYLSICICVLHYTRTVLQPSLNHILLLFSRPYEREGGEGGGGYRVPSAMKCP